MDRVLTCSCGEKIVVSRAQAGQNVNCPKCGVSNNVPTLRGLSELPAVESESTPATINTSDTWQFHGPVLAICFGIILITGVYAAMQFYEARGTYIPFTPAMHIEGEQEAVDQLSPDALLHLWDTYSSISLGPKRPPEYKIYNDYSSSCWRTALISTSIALTAAVIAAATMLSARKKKQAAKQPAKK